MFLENQLDPQSIGQGPCVFWGRATNQAGQKMRMILQVERVLLSQDVAWEIISKISNKTLEAGFCTPSKVLGLDFFTAKENTRVQVLN